MSIEATASVDDSVAEADRRRLFEEIFEEYSASIVAYFKRQGLSSDHALELAQETFLRAWKGIDDFRFESSCSTWLFTIARHVLLNLWRDRQAKKREGMTCSLDQDHASTLLEERSSACPENAAISQEKLMMLRQELSTLPPQMRQCLELRLGDLKYREIAAILGLSLETVKSHLFQARHRLKLNLRHYFVADFDETEKR